ncbi:MAG: acyl-CoA thioesterase [Chloroflexota bacterium]|nr:acyl-CoA thioesterase [Ardenticatenaceae bacterium]GIK54897.1 MAG: acyl-CoA thioesterase [Chloroflexota bacterium]
MSQLRPLLVTLSITVKTYDIDFAHIVHNAVYIRWLEDLRQQLVAEHYPMAQALADGRTPILTHTDIHYKWTTRFGDEVVGQMWISQLSRTKWEVQAEIWANGLVAAAATQNGYFADLATLRPTRIPELLRQKWLSARE